MIRGWRFDSTLYHLKVHKTSTFFYFLSGAVRKDVIGEEDMQTSNKQADKQKIRRWSRQWNTELSYGRRDVGSLPPDTWCLLQDLFHLLLYLLQNVLWINNPVPAFFPHLYCYKSLHLYLRPRSRGKHCWCDPPAGFSHLQCSLSGKYIHLFEQMSCFPPCTLTLLWQTPEGIQAPWNCLSGFSLLCVWNPCFNSGYVAGLNVFHFVSSFIFDLVWQQHSLTDSSESVSFWN